MIEHDFLLFMEYFIKHIIVTKDKSILIQMKIISHAFLLKALNNVTDYGAVLLSFPPPTNHKLKPLDRSNASGAWLVNQ
jgi:hypothetical protein